jgi:hypothetical protein
LDRREFFKNDSRKSGMRRKRNIRCMGAMVLVLIVSGAVAAGEEPVLRVDFESSALGLYTAEAIRRDWPKIAWAALHDRACIVQDDEERGKVLRIRYPAGSLGPGQGGGQFLVPLPPSEELWLSYHLKFGAGFDFRRGGKLPGLTSGGSRYTGGTIPKEGDGWSARYMWRPRGRIGVYAYYVDMPGPWGQMFGLDEAATLVPGKWHQIAQRIQINTPGQADGEIEVWFDGKQVLSRSGIRWRVGEKGQIDSLYFSTFHGGNTPDWAPHVDCVAFFDEFVISREPPEFVLCQSADESR